VVDREGRERPLLDARGPYTFVRLSPDGRTLAVEQTRANEDLWVYDLDRGSGIRFASGWDNLRPVWTPDGRQLVFSSNSVGYDQLFMAPVDGSAPARALTGGEEHEFPLDVSPDGRTLVYQQIPGRRELWRLSLGGEANPQPVLRGSADHWDARFSPDGRWLAYESDESGRAEIYVRPFPGPGGRHLVSAGGGYSPRWTRGGREIVYEAPDGIIVSVAITLAPVFQASRPQPVWKGPRRSFISYDVSADGQRFVFSVPGPSRDAPREITVVTNWLEELKRLAPPGR
jgi:Tol biopolymer transport system component